MTPDAPSSKSEGLIVHVPVARPKALTHAVLWGGLALVLGVTTVMIYERLEFRPTGVSNRLVDYSIAVAAFPIALAAVFVAMRSLRWLLLCVWPGPLGVYAGEDALVLRLGSFGTQRYDAARLDVRYPFELSADADEGDFEAFLPEQEQLAKLLPRIAHPEASEPLNVVILRYAGMSQTEAASAFGPILERWRARGQAQPAGRPSPSDVGA